MSADPAIGQLELVPIRPATPAGQPVYAVRVDLEPHVARRPRARAMPAFYSSLREEADRLVGSVATASMVGLRDLKPTIIDVLKRLCSQRNAFVAQVYDDPGYAKWRRAMTKALQAQWAGRPPLPLALYVAQVVLVLPRPRSAPRQLTVGGQSFRYPLPWTPGRNPHAGVEDLDNLRKGPLDALVQAGVLPDDRLIVRDGGSGKWWAGESEPACVEIRLWTV